jgi:protein TonB
MIVLAFTILNRTHLPLKPNVAVEIKEVIRPKKSIPEKPIVVNTTVQKSTTTHSKIQPRPVFGINKKTLVSNEVGAVSIKAGNTIAKEIDQEILRPEDAQALPIPTDEYLITKMPSLKSEIRIPYPVEARAKGVEGLVLLEILIDENGKVRSATLVQGPGFGLNEAALNAIHSFEFSPAMVDQKPVSVRIRYGYRFVLN